MIQEKEWEIYYRTWSYNGGGSSGSKDCDPGDVLIKQWTSGGSAGTGAPGFGCITSKCGKKSSIRNHGKEYAEFRKDANSLGDLYRVGDDGTTTLVASGVSEQTQARLRQEKFTELVKINYGLR